MGEREKGFPIVPGLYCPLMLKMSCLAFKVATEQCIYHVSIKFVVPGSHWTGILSLARYAVCLGLSPGISQPLNDGCLQYLTNASFASDPSLLSTTLLLLLLLP
jgi:hypothetical protein